MLKVIICLSILFLIVLVTSYATKKFSIVIIPAMLLIVAVSVYAWDSYGIINRCKYLKEKSDTADLFETRLKNENIQYIRKDNSFRIIFYSISYDK